MTTARALDKFYTDPACARACVADIEAWGGFRLDALDVAILEPSAGAGAFLDALPGGALAYDIAPEDPRVVRQDFLALRRTDPALVVGNPPFGRAANLAVAFFNHAATFATHIGFIVPRTFEKHSVQRRLDPHFHLLGQRVLDPRSFAIDGKPYAVPCVFQLWERRATPRPPTRPALSHPDFVFTTREDAAFAVQRVGVRAGTVKTDTAALAPASHHFIRPVIDADEALERFRRIDADSVKHRTAGNPSISKAELVELYARTLQDR